MAAVDWNKWLYTVGDEPQYDQALNFTNADTNSSETLAIDYVAGAGDTSPDNYEDYNDYISNRKVIFHITLN